MEKISFYKESRFRLIMISTFLWGFAAHGMAMLNKYSYHDDVPWFNGVGETYGLGRWSLGLSGKISEYFYCSRNYSLPLFNGILTILSVALIVYILCRRLDIKNRVLLVALSGVMVCFPAVTNIFGYSFTAPFYYFAALIGIIGALLYYTYDNIPSFIACSLLMAFSVGMYQSNIAINLSVMLLFMFQKIYESDTNWKDYVILALKNAALSAAFMAEYFIFNMAALKITGQGMYDYKGVSSFGATDVTGYVQRVISAYKRFLKPADHINYNGVSANMFPWNLKYLHMLLVVICFVLLVIILKKIGSLRRIIQLLVLAAVSPLFSYFLYVMVEQDHAHGGMAFGEAFMFVFAAYLIEQVSGNREKDTATGRTLSCLAGAAVTVMIIMGVMFTRFANVCYLKADLMQAEAINYYNTLITRIRMTEGYTRETPVAYIGPREKNDDDFSGNRLFDPIYLPPYQGNSIINDFSWEETMNMWCSFSRVEADESDIADWDTISLMPCYPDNGSVKMVDGILVVKFSD